MDLWVGKEKMRRGYKNVWRENRSQKKKRPEKRRRESESEWQPGSSTSFTVFYCFSLSFHCSPAEEVNTDRSVIFSSLLFSFLSPLILGIVLAASEWKAADDSFHFLLLSSLLCVSDREMREKRDQWRWSFIFTGSLFASRLRDHRISGWGIIMTDIMRREATPSPNSEFFDSDLKSI